jgi:2-iminobutanoate/2-iminopropanoate deaminase
MPTRILVLIFTVLPLLTAAAADVEFLNPAGVQQEGRPFSEATRVGDLLFLSGQLGAVPGTSELAAGGIGPETRQTLENIKTTLERHGSSLGRVAKCTVFLADIAEWPAMNEVYVEYFGPAYPARSAVAGSGLALNARVEIECIAAASGG